jgi:hypothetical protein
LRNRSAVICRLGRRNDGQDLDLSAARAVLQRAASSARSVVDRAAIGSFNIVRHAPGWIARLSAEIDSIIYSLSDA